MIYAIMPTFNQERFIGEALDSIVSQVDRLVVVDDGSTDGTAGVLARRGIRPVRHSRNSGTAEAINTGFQALKPDLSVSDWVTWVSSDNVYLPGWREGLLSVTGSGVGAAYSAYQRLGAGGSLSAYYRHYDPSALVASEDCYFGPSFLIRADVWIEAGSHRGRISHDYDHWCRVEEVCWRRGLEIRSNPQSLCHYRVHDARVTVTRRKEYDAPHWRASALTRRASASEKPGGE